MNLPTNIIDLAEKNLALIERTGFVPGVDDPHELCTPDAYRRTGIFSNVQIDELFDFNTEAPASDAAALSPSTGMILVRPDMFHISSKFEDFIKQRFKIITAENVTMTQAAYWDIYRHDLYRLSTMHSRLTRAAMYIGSTCRLIVFKDAEDSDVNISDQVVRELKGSQGNPQPNTLRGEIVYKEALRLGLHDVCKNGRIQMATDPFAAYRKLSQEEHGPHTRVGYPLLFFTGVGVHVPNGAEIAGDLRALKPDLAEQLTAS